MKVSIKPFPKKGGRRKINVQIERHDTWSLDHTLAIIIYPALIQLKAIKKHTMNHGKSLPNAGTKY